MKWKLYLLIISVSLYVSACDQNKQGSNEIPVADFLTQILGDEQEKMKAGKVVFSPDYKTFSVTGEILQGIGSYELQDSSQVKTEVVETIDGIRQARLSTPRLLKINNIEADRISEADVRLLVLVDLTLPQADLNNIRTFVGEMKTVFKHNNLYVAFMDSNSVSNTVKVTDYVLEHYFVKTPHTYVYLYRSILQKRFEMLHREGVWQDAAKLVLLTFSNEKVYHDDSDQPVDPNHYLFQEQMAKMDSSSVDSSFSSYYASFNHRDEDNEDDEENLLRLFCGNNGGAFLKDFQWVIFKNSMFENFHLSFPDYEFFFENPDFKVYRGDNKKLTLNFYDAKTDSLITSLSTSVVMGELFIPIIVHGHGIKYVILQGLFLGLILLFLVYFVLQIILPFVKYRIFLHKYVMPYTGHNMSFDNKAVEESCYLCKAPFEPGEKIVVKCEHTMHKSCWDENNYHCPEYSDRCKHGAHYYNYNHIFDHHNAPFYLRWILMALAASTLAWLCFILYVHFFTPQTPLSTHHSMQPPVFGLLMGFFLTLGITILAIRPGKDIRAIANILLRAVIAAVGSYLSFLVIDLMIYLFDISTIAFLLNWIPWTASGFIIAYCSTFATRIVHSKILILFSVLIGFLSMYSWIFFFRYTELDFRVLLLISFIIYGVALAACIATVAPRSERYFLKVEGAMKGMEIALYKWFRNNPDYVVTIGKSVDCSLQLSWDIQSDVAPIQAEIRMRKHVLYLIPLEPGLYLYGKPARVNKRIRLHHGKKFTIGKTSFSYIEKDR